MNGLVNKHTVSSLVRNGERHGNSLADKYIRTCAINMNMNKGKTPTSCKQWTVDDTTPDLLTPVRKWIWILTVLSNNSLRLTPHL